MVSYSFSFYSPCRSSSKCNSHLKFSCFCVIKFPFLCLHILILGLQLFLISLILYRTFEFYLPPPMSPHLSTVPHNNFSSALSLFFYDYTFLLIIIFSYSYSTIPSVLFCCISQYVILILGCSFTFIKALLSSICICPSRCTLCYSIYASCQKIPDVINIPALLCMH